MGLMTVLKVQSSYYAVFEERGIFYKILRLPQGES